MLGQRDEGYREAIAVPSIGERVRLNPAEAVHGQAADEASAHLDRTTPGWWVHVDLDVVGAQNWVHLMRPADTRGAVR
jgi:hypothetical protein